ncbi:MAG: DUF445 family protein [Spirochaetes bacterium]|nr:DUF445 family protein [Spirochaetota bacterium]
MIEILRFAALPVIGAIIGYSTNVVAVKMLFRPLKEVRIFGIRLPFTPGILPRQRRHLAESIGAMVERELFTAEILRQRLDREEVREKIKLSISLFTEKMLAAKPGELFSAKPHSQIEVADNPKNFIHEKILHEVEDNYPAITSALLNFLRTYDVRRQLEAKGHVLLSKIILKLNPFQQLFISATKYDVTLTQKMPEIIEDLLVSAENMLADDSVKKELLDKADLALEQFLGRGDKSLGESLKLDADDKQKLDEQIFAHLQSVMDEQIEKMLDSVNVKEMVRERIDSLDMLKVEKIILDVMANQFTWIHIFGGILGFLIGLFQLFLMFALGSF